MPAQNGVGLEDDESLFPVSDEPSQDQEREAIAAVEVRTFDLALKDDELLTQQGIFKDQLTFGPGEVGEGIKEDEGLSGGSRPATKEPIQQ